VWDGALSAFLQFVVVWVRRPERRQLEPGQVQPEQRQLERRQLEPGQVQPEQRQLERWQLEPGQVQPEQRQLEQAQLEPAQALRPPAQKQQVQPPRLPFRSLRSGSYGRAESLGWVRTRFPRLRHFRRCHFRRCRHFPLCSAQR
jgi:hypothetical protein